MKKIPYIYIYSHTTIQKYFGHPQKYSFLIPKVLFLIKQIKHHNCYICYTTYKSSWTKLNTNSTKKHKNFLQLFIHQNDPLLAIISASHVLGILSTNDWM